MERETSMIINLSKTEQMKAVSSTRKRLFPSWDQPPETGELQKVIFKTTILGGGDDEIKRAGSWWLWIRKLMIENTISKEEINLLMEAGVNAAVGKQPIDLLSARSPELLHAQVTSQTDRSLPRSKQALGKLFEISTASREFVPTNTSIIFADLAIDNLEKIQQVCDISKTVSENICLLHKIAQDMGFSDLSILRMSELTVDNKKLSDLLDRSGAPKSEILFSNKAITLIDIVTKESIQSHKNMFGWNLGESRKHNENIAATMGFVGKAIKRIIPKAIIIHNESFISRGQLNNIFNDKSDPVPVICLRDLLETKRYKI